jgi:hypothetical protein
VEEVFDFVGCDRAAAVFIHAPESYFKLSLREYVDAQCADKTSLETAGWA